MSKKVETIEINAIDEYGDVVTDAVNKKFYGDRIKPKGYVDIFEADEDGNKHLVGRHNLVLYTGREWLAQKLVNLNNSAIIPSKDDWINWFGLGNGGVIPGDPFNPSPPIIDQTELSSKVMINATDSSAADYHVISPGYDEEGYYKIPFDTIEFEQDVQNDDKWLVVKITVTVGIDDANGKQLSEAGLFTSPSDAGGPGNLGPFNIFSRVTFPSIVKTSDRRIIFNWYLYV